MDKSIFTDKEHQPDSGDLLLVLDSTYSFWQMLADYTHALYPGTIDEWNYPGDKYGWSFRIKDKKRAILYLLPREKYFKVAFVFGQKAFDIILNSNINEIIKTELLNARTYAEGRGIRIDIRDESLIRDIKELIEIKISS